MWELDHKEGWQPTYWCFWIVVLKKTLENPLDCREIKPVNPIGNQPWILTGRADAEAKALILWHLMQRAHSLEKTECKRKGQQKTRWLDSIINSEDVNLRKLWETAEYRGTWHAAVHRVAKSSAWLSNSTATGYWWPSLFSEKRNLCIVLAGARIHKVERMERVLHY